MKSYRNAIVAKGLQKPKQSTMCEVHYGVNLYPKNAPLVADCHNLLPKVSQ